MDDGLGQSAGCAPSCTHLYGLFPSNQISPYRTPELFDAARTSLIHRGDPSTGWSMGWKDMFVGPSVGW